MIAHYLKSAFRSIARHKLPGIISIIGLAIGFACFALSALWIRYELSFDNFHSNADNIYLVQISNPNYSGKEPDNITPSVLAPYLKSAFPEIEDACAVSRNYLELKNGNVVEGYQALNIDSSFCNMFNIPKNNLFTNTLSIHKPVIATNQFVKSFWGDNNTGEKQLEGTENQLYNVVNTVNEWPKNTNLPFDLLMYRTPNFQIDSWNASFVQTYILLNPSVNVEAFKKKLSSVHIDGNHFNPTKITITPITQIHYKLVSSNSYNMLPNANVNVKLNHVVIFSVTGLLVIVCALFNYLTLFISRIKVRSKELALRKINGSSNRQIIQLLCSEFLLILICSLLIGCGTIAGILPKFKQLSMVQLSNTSIFTEVLIYAFLLALLGLLLAFSLTYYLQKRSLNENIKGATYTGNKNIFRKVSIIIQLIVSIALLFCTIVFFMQLHKIQYANIGFDRHNVCVMHAYQSQGMDNEIQNKIKQLPTVTDLIKVYDTFLTPIGSSHYTYPNWEDKTIEGSVSAEAFHIPADYIGFFKMKILKGENFNPKENNADNLLINESAAKAFGWGNDKAVGKTIGVDQRVIGVVQDCFIKSPTDGVKPSIFFYTDENLYYYAIRYKEGTREQTQKSITDFIKQWVPEDQITFKYLDDAYESYYKSERNLFVLLGIMTSVCIVIALFGVYAMATLTCQQRRREIAIRKINGADIKKILILFIKEYLALVLIASIIALPPAYIIMQRWVEQYNIQTSISWWLFIVIVIAVGLIITATIISNVWKAATTNPAEVIKSE